MDISTWILLIFLTVLAGLYIASKQQKACPVDDGSWILIWTGIGAIAIYSVFQAVCWVWDVLFG